MQNIDNYFALEDDILKRIKSEIPEVEEIVTPFDVEDLFQAIVGDIGIGIIYVGDRLASTTGDGKANAIYQQWLIALSVADASAQLPETASIRQLADPIIRKILAAMQGYQPQIVGFKRFQRVDAGIPVGKSVSSGRAYFPFLFESQMIKVW
ncbi:hypothetical protein [Acinetobacter piscicola]|uniref:phage tail terminator protein n=1 Tax=Acinetobacter piscicola TaxID=2006115 RepID=UPI001020A646|nr:hypothetical protein [Acinetobacter piscicola]RYL25111.1 hypothetical protein EWP19_13100 [Acinetobacter piscicola]